MDIRSLEVFLTLSETLHFGKVAEQLSMSQSSVSEHVRRLEARIGQPLFDRTSRRVRLTAAGEIFAHRVRDPLKAIRLAIREAEHGGKPKGETLRVGFLGGGFYEFYEPLLKAHKADDSKVALEFVELHYDSQFSAILNGEVDAAFCRLPLGLDGLEAGPIVMSDPRVVCVNVAHRLAGRDHIDAEELRGETMLRVPASLAGTKWCEYHFPLATPDGHRLMPGPIIRTVREGVAAVVAGHGIFFLTKRAAKYFETPRMSFVEVNLPPIQSALVWREDDARVSIHSLNRALLRVAREARAT